MTDKSKRFHISRLIKIPWNSVNGNAQWKMLEVMTVSQYKYLFSCLKIISALIWKYCDVTSEALLKKLSQNFENVSLSETIFEENLKPCKRKQHEVQHFFKITELHSHILSEHTGENNLRSTTTYLASFSRAYDPTFIIYLLHANFNHVAFQESRQVIAQERGNENLLQGLRSTLPFFASMVKSVQIM